MNFSDRLKLLRGSHKKEQKDIADLLGISVRSIRFYESGKNEPSISRLILLADYFDVSIDYLVGRTDNPKVNE